MQNAKSFCSAPSNKSCNCLHSSICVSWFNSNFEDATAENSLLWSQPTMKYLLTPAGSKHEVMLSCAESQMNAHTSDTIKKELKSLQQVYLWHLPFINMGIFLSIHKNIKHKWIKNLDSSTGGPRTRHEEKKLQWQIPEIFFSRVLITNLTQN